LKLKINPNGHRVTEISLAVYLVRDLRVNRIPSMLLDCVWDSWIQNETMFEFSLLVRFEEPPPSTGPGDQHRTKRRPFIICEGGELSYHLSSEEGGGEDPFFYKIHCNSMLIERSAEHPERPWSRVGIAYS
jgi:hypothetical protein